MRFCRSGVKPFAGDLDVRLDIAGGFVGGLYGVCLDGNQFRNSDQVAGDEIQQKSSGDTSNAAVFGLAHCAMLFAPAEDTFDHLAALLRLIITPMPCRAAINRASRRLPVLVGLLFCATCGVTPTARRFSIWSFVSSQARNSSRHPTSWRPKRSTPSLDLSTRNRLQSIIALIGAAMTMQLVLALAAAKHVQPALDPDDVESLLGIGGIQTVYFQSRAVDQYLQGPIRHPPARD